MSTERPDGRVNQEAAPSVMGVVAAVFKNPGFTACVVLLVLFTAGFHLLAIQQNVHFIKDPVFLEKPLEDLDHDKLKPYEVAEVGQIEPAVLDALGTTDYIQWTLEDTSIVRRSLPEKWVHLFVTYYTDKPDQVPHVPEECYLGSGYRAIDENLIDVPIPALGPDVVVPFKVLTFEKSLVSGDESRIVIYAFHTNGQFCPDRRCVQLVVRDPRMRHAYFSKIEVSFGLPGAYPSQEVAIKASKKFLQKVIPVLVADHFADWDAVVEAENSEGSGE